MTGVDCLAGVIGEKSKLLVLEVLFAVEAVLLSRTVAVLLFDARRASVAIFSLGFVGVFNKLLSDPVGMLFTS